MRRVAEFGSDGFAGVFEDEEIVAFGDGLECVHVRWNAEGVDDQQGTSAGGDGALDGGGVEVQGDGVDLRKDGRGAHLEDSVSDGDEGKGGDDDLVAGADAES